MTRIDRVEIREFDFEARYRARDGLAQSYGCGCSDQLDCIDADRMVSVPDGPALGVTLDWDYIEKHRPGLSVYK
jgi:hypothetical protein